MNGINALPSSAVQTVKTTAVDSKAKAAGSATALPPPPAGGPKEAPGTQCSFSSKGLQELSMALHEAYDGASDIVGGVAHAVSDGASAVEHGALKIGDAVYSIASTSANEVESAAKYVGDKVSDLATGAWNVVSSTAHEVADVTEAAADYVGKAVLTGAQALNKLV